MIDRGATQYQDDSQHESAWRMDPEGKGSGNVRRRAAGIDDNSAKRGYLDGQLLIFEDADLAGFDIGGADLEMDGVYGGAQSGEIDMFAEYVAQRHILAVACRAIADKLVGTPIHVPTASGGT